MVPAPSSVPFPASSLPPPLKLFCQDPPWRVSSALFDRESVISDSIFKKVQVLPSDPEFKFVWKYFYQQQPVNRAIKCIYFIHNTRLNQQFENEVSAAERLTRNDTFKPRWRAEEPITLRQKVSDRFKKLASLYTTFTIPWEKKPETCSNVTVLPLWHGSTKEKANSICEAGFHSFGKHAFLGKGGSSQGSTDVGYFGNGIYFTASARYAADCYSDGENLFLGWVAMREPYPVVNDKPVLNGGPQRCSDMKKLEGLGHYENYNTHYIPVVPLTPNPDCKIYYPCPEGMEPVYDEVVVFFPSQTICRFWIEMQVDLTKIIPKPPLSANLFLDLVIKLADHSEIKKKYPSLAEKFRASVSDLSYAQDSQNLESDDSDFYELAQELLLPDNKIREDIATLLLKTSLPKHAFTPKPPLISTPAKPLDHFSPLPPKSNFPVLPVSTVSLQQASKQSLPPLSTLSLPSGDLNYLKMTNKATPLEELKAIPISEFLSAINKEPNIASLYQNLGRVFPAGGGSIPLLDGTNITRQKLYLKAIALDQNLPKAYYNLACTLSDGESIQLLDGTNMTQQKLYLKAIALDQNIPNAYYNIALTLSDGESIQLLDGTNMTQQKLYLKAIALDQNLPKAYYNIALTLSDGESIQLLDGTNMTQQKLYLKAIALDQNFAEAYYYLAFTLSDGESIQLLDGTNMTQQKLILKTIALNPNMAEAYIDLGASLSPGGSIQLLNGTTMTAQELYLKAIALDSNCAVAYENLAIALPVGGSVQLPNGTAMTPQQLLLKAIDLNPASSAMAYVDLGALLPFEESVQLFNGTTMTAQELCLKAIALDPKCANAYNNLGARLSVGRSILLPNGVRMARHELYLKAIDLDPKCALAYNNLGQTFLMGTSIRLLNGTFMTHRQLYLKTIELDPNYLPAYHSLGMALRIGETIMLPNGVTMTRQQLLDKSKGK